MISLFRITIVPVLFSVAVGLALYICIRHNRRCAVYPEQQVFLFHPAAGAGGGGEKCLWALLELLFKSKKDRNLPLRINLFVTRTTEVSIDRLLRNATSAFGSQLPNVKLEENQYEATLDSGVTLRLIPLTSAFALFYLYPIATQLIQMLAGIPVAIEAALRTQGTVHDEIWDTTGLSSTVWAFSLLTSQMRRKCKCYIHWPFVSLDESKRRSVLWKVYREILLWLFRQSAKAFRHSNIVVNSTFTYKRMVRSWPSFAHKISKLYPPIDTLGEFSVHSADGKENIVISVGQFRPEKNHIAQLHIIRKILIGHKIPEPTRFLICGSCRPDSNDYDFVRALLSTADELFSPNLAHIILNNSGHYAEHRKCKAVSGKTNSPHSVEFHVDLGVSELFDLIRRSKVGLHTMIAEHFGIVLVEFMLCQVYVVAHNSAGPRDDVLAPITVEEYRQDTSLEELGLFSQPLGCLATTEDDFVDGIVSGLAWTPEVRGIAELASRIAKRRFPNKAEFAKKLLELWKVDF